MFHVSYWILSSGLQISFCLFLLKGNRSNNSIYFSGTNMRLSYFRIHFGQLAVIWKNKPTSFDFEIPCRYNCFSALQMTLRNYFWAIYVYLKPYVTHYKIQYNWTYTKSRYHIFPINCVCLWVVWICYLHLPYLKVSYLAFASKVNRRHSNTYISLSRKLSLFSF